MIRLTLPSISLKARTHLLLLLAAAALTASSAIADSSNIDTTRFETLHARDNIAADNIASDNIASDNTATRGSFELATINAYQADPASNAKPDEAFNDPFSEEPTFDDANTVQRVIPNPNGNPPGSTIQGAVFKLGVIVCGLAVICILFAGYRLRPRENA